MRSLLLRGATAALLAVVAVSAFAQGGGRMQMFGGGAGNDFRLLGRKDVQTDLKVTAEQKTKIDAAQASQQDAMRSMFQGAQDMSQEERTKLVTKMQEDQKKVYEGIISKEQLARLKEIGIQLAGNRAVAREDVQKELAVTDDQKTKIKALQAKQQEAQMALFEKMRNGELEREEMQTIIQKNNETMGTELGKILTTEQADKLKKLGGAPFKADPNERIR